MTTPTKVLLIEDGSDDARLIVEALNAAAEATFDLVWVDTLQKGIDRLREGDLEVILLDLGLPDSRGLDTLKTIRARSPELPIVVLTSLQDEKIAAKAIAQGAQDYFVKEETDPAVLVRSIRYAIERKRSARELAEWRERYEKTLDNLDAAVLAIDPNTRLIYECNFTAEKIFGYPRDELVGRDIRVLHPSEAAFEKFSQETTAAIDGIGYFRGELTLQRKSGETFPCECFLRPIHREGRMQSIVAALRDIGERKRAEADALRGYMVAAEIGGLYLRASEEAALLREACRLLVQTGGFCLAWVGLADAGAERGLRPAAQAVRGDGAPGEILWSDALGHDGPTLEAFKSGKVSLAKDVLNDSRYAPWRPDAIQRGYGAVLGLPLVAGETRLGALTLHAERPETFSPDMVKLFQDIASNLAFCIAAVRQRAEQQRAEENLRRSEERFQKIAGALPQVLWLASMQSRQLQYLSPGFEGVFGRAPDGLIGERDAWLSLVHPEDRERVTETIKSHHGTSYQMEYRIIRPDGSTRWIHERLLPLPGTPASSTTTVLGISEDITERRRTEEERAYLETMRQRDQKMAIASRLAEGLAREFCDLLTRVVGGADQVLATMATEHPLTPELVEIKRAGERAAALTHHMLAFTRPPLLPVTVLDLNEVISGAQRTLHRLLGDKIDLFLFSQEPLGKIEAAFDQIEELLIDLAANAHDAMPGGGKLTLETANVTVDAEQCRLHPEATPGEYVRLSVADSGAGLGQEAREHLFEPFFSTKGQGSTGLGLFTVFGIVRQNRGFIEVVHGEKAGVNFRIYLPRARSDTTPQVAPEEPRPAGQKTVLIVEDDEVVRRLAKRTLEKEGFLVLAAAQGDEALALGEARPDRLDLLLTDVNPPKLNGRELYLSLRKRHPGMRVLYMSGYPEDTLPHHEPLTKGTPVINKPFSTKALAKKVREVLENVVGTPGQ